MFLDFLKANSQEVDQFLEEYLLEYTNKVERINPKFKFLMDNFRESCRGGKRIRAALVRLGYELAGGNNAFEKQVLKVACGYEIFQTAILAHDDIIDKSELRRGEPSLYMRLGGGHYGISQAIILSDIGFFLTIKTISESDFPDPIRAKAVSTFADTFLKTGLGETLDVEVSFKRDGVNLSDVETINLLKTADYSVVGPLRLGIVLAGGNDKLIDSIQKFGEDLGVAFQLQDDILGVFGSEEETGKSTSSDIEEGKTTLLYLKASEKANDIQKKFLDENYGKGRRPEGTLEKVKKIFTETGAVDYCKEESARLINRSKGVIYEMDISQEKKDLLFEMADFLIERTK